jgi:hypothetical protein
VEFSGHNTMSGAGPPDVLCSARAMIVWER